MAPRMVKVVGDTAVYFLFEDRIHKTTTASTAYNIARGWGVLGSGQVAATVAEAISPGEFAAVRDEIDANNLAVAQRIGTQVPVTVQGASEQFIQDKVDTLRSRIGQDISIHNGNTVTLTNQVLAKIDATHTP